MNRIGPSLVACAAFFMLPGNGVANDSAANQTSGGLVFTRTEAVAMRSEELRISQKLIEVRYEFQNITDKDVTLTVAFPLPDVEPDYYSSDSDRDILGEKFETNIDGVPIALKAERKAIFKGKDIAGELEAMELSPNPEEMDDKLQSLPKGGASKLVAAPLKSGYITAYDGYRSEIAWTYRRSFYRQQVFPAGKTVVVTHRYTPSVGASMSLPFDRNESENEITRKYCIDKDIVRSVLNAEKKGDIYFYRYVNYILSTGANWAGGRIGNFRLVVDKGAPENVVAFCGTGIRKISPTQFEMVKKDFRPRGDLDIAIFERVGTQAK